MSYFEKRLPKYKAKLLNGKEVYFRPFLIKDEKNLSIIKEESRNDLIIKTVIDLVNDCFDSQLSSKAELALVEQCFLFLRAKSMGEQIDLEITCPTTQEKHKLSINVLDHKINLIEGKTLNLNNGEVVTFESLKAKDCIEKDLSVEEKVALHIKSFENNDEYFLMDNLPLEERVEVLKNLKIDEYNKIKDFIENNPELHFEVNYTTSDGITRTAIIGEHLRFFS